MSYLQDMAQETGNRIFGRGSPQAEAFLAGALWARTANSAWLDPQDANDVRLVANMLCQPDAPASHDDAVLWFRRSRELGYP